MDKVTRCSEDMVHWPGVPRRTELQNEAVHIVFSCGLSVRKVTFGVVLPTERSRFGVGPRYLVYFLVLLWWQRIRWLLCNPLIVFVDKLCIAQHDEELKD